MARPEWRNYTRQHHQGLAARLLTRGDLLKLKTRSRIAGSELSPESLAWIIGAEAFEQAPPRYREATEREFLSRARAMLDPSRNRSEKLDLSQRTRAAIIAAFDRA
jgi:hypothetical protein